MQIDMKYIIKHIFAFNIHNSKKQTCVGRMRPYTLDKRQARAIKQIPIGPMKP